ncbi:MAG: ribonuclease III [Chloroflexia bacterium]
MEEELDILERALGLTFRDRSLLFQALVHRSFLNENPDSRLSSNDRLEFLGDAVLDALAAEYVFHHHPEKGEGEMTLLRSALVRTETLARFARSLGLGRFLVMGRGEENDGGRERASILAGAFEALIGAIYLDAGLEAVRSFVARFLEAEAERWHERKPLDFKSALQIHLQAQYNRTPEYRTLASWGPDHARMFRVEVRLGDRVLGVGEGPSKQAAQQDAARRALEALRRGKE